MNQSKINQTQLEQLKMLFLKNEGRYYTGKFLQSLLVLNKMGVQDGIRKLREDNIPIVSRGVNGYTYSTDKEEILKTGLSLKNRGQKIVDIGNQMIKLSMGDQKHYYNKE